MKSLLLSPHGKLSLVQQTSHVPDQRGEDEDHDRVHDDILVDVGVNGDNQGNAYYCSSYQGAPAW